MSTFGVLLMLLFIIIFGVQIFLYCVDIDMPRLSGCMTLALYLILISELIIAIFEFPAKLIDGIVYISMGYKAIAVGCGVVIFFILAFVFIMLYPKINWQKVLTSSPVKYVVMGGMIILLMVYTEIFNGIYSFSSIDEYFTFKSEFSQYDNHFWPTKYIQGTQDYQGEEITTYSVYPWDVDIPSGHQFVYKVITFYDEDENDGSTRKLFYFPFTYRLFAGVEPAAIDEPAGLTPLVSDSDVSDSDTE